MEEPSDGDQKLFCGVADELDRPIRIVDVDEDGALVLDEVSLSKILLQDDIKDLPVSIISIAGCFRKGKSLMLDFFLRYLPGSGQPGWIGKGDEPLKGFSWRGGSEADTRGILMWSKAFKMRNALGEEFAVLLMDTQGSFDCTSTMKQCSAIFALSTMISSLQIYNISQNIGTDDLNHLDLFTDYGRLALNTNSSTPFQKMLFLVRDWSCPYEYPFGAAGGQQLLDKRLEDRPEQPKELKMVTQHIRDCFTDISCYLMPHPGLKAATDETFDGRLNDLDVRFSEHLAILVPLVLSPRNHSLKFIGGQKITTNQLMIYFQTYVKIFNGNTLPSPMTTLQATAEANNRTAVAAAKDMYLKSMSELCCATNPYIPETELESRHRIIMEQALAHFDSFKKMGGDEIAAKHRNWLSEDMEDQLFEFLDRNKTKEPFRAIKIYLEEWGITSWNVLVFGPAVVVHGAMWICLPYYMLGYYSICAAGVGIGLAITYFDQRYNILP